ncbi:hypothetical protein [Phaeobacter inhibens]|uniref:hypothetical protein n=1 Tax=Phaeobacter inhibens TaxID=221822 RepID=UPI0021A56566|nr:hypothetical protein [Phaeobacter inhibens]UWR60190.1 hypothetical protein K4F88_14930 [Phaeobacter inhibens]
MEPDFQAGMKSRQVVQLNFDMQSHLGAFETGVTSIVGAEFASIRDGFEVLDVKFDGDRATLRIKGETASAVQVLPNINYTFDLTIYRDGSAVLDGCHDGYPSYRVSVEGETRYYFAHAPNDLIKLVGECDIRLSSGTKGRDTALTLTSTQMVPDGAGTGAVIFEASSSHAAVRLFYEDPVEARTAAPVYAVTEFERQDGLPSYAVVRRVAEQAVAGQGKAGRVTSAILTGKFANLVQPMSLPAADLRYVVRADSDLVKALDARLETEFPTLGAEMVPDDYVSVSAAMARLMHTAAELAQNDRLRVPINSAGDRLGLPDPSIHASGLGWLWAYVYQSESHSGLSGCVPDTSNMLPPKSDGQTRHLGLYLDLLKNTHEGRLALVAAAGYYTGGVAARLYASSVALDALELIYQGLRNDGYAAFLALGQFDPVRVQIARCKGLRLLRGPIDPVGPIIERSEMYRAASEEIKRRREAEGGQVPQFFDAARAVTRLVGVGLVDLADDVDLDNDTIVVKAAQDIMGAAGCIGSSEKLLPDRRDRAFLREVNAELLEFNQPRMRRLFDAPRQLFDPVTLGKLHVPDGMDPALYFDLRMVLAEQGHVETLLRSEEIAAGSARDNALSAAEKAMRCLSAAWLRHALDLPAGGTPHLDIVADVDRFLEALIGAGVLPQTEARFTSKRWRVAIGSAFVYALHRQEVEDEAAWLQDYVDYMRVLFATETADARRNPNVPLALQRRISVVARQAEGRWPAGRLDTVSRAGVLFLNTPQGTVTYRCTGEGNTRRLDRAHDLPPLATSRQLIARLDRHGAGTLALPFELVSSGGALNEDLKLGGRPDPDRFCAVLERRHEALNCAMQTDATSGCRTDGLRISGDDGTQSFVLLEKSVDLRRDLGVLGPFLIDEFNKLPRQPIDAGIQTAVSTAADREAAYSRNLALALAVAEEPTAVLQALGLEDTDPAFWRDLVQQAQPQETKDTVFVLDDAVDAEAVQDYAARNSLSERTARVNATEEKLAQAVAPLLRSAGVESATTAAPQEVEETRPGREQPVGGTKTAKDFMDNAALQPGDTGIGFELSEIAASNEGFARYKGTLVYRRASTAGGATVCPQGEDGQTCAGQGAETQAISSGSDTESIPLGLEIVGLTFTPSGHLAVASAMGEADFDYFPEQTRAALYKLGMPRGIGLERVRFDISPDLKSLTLHISLFTGGSSSFEVAVPIIRDGEFTDLEDTARAAILSELNRYLQTEASALNLDVAFAPTEALPWGLRVSAEGLKPRIDWAGGNILADVVLELTIGRGASASKLFADGEVMLSTDVTQLRRIDFRPFDQEALVTAVQSVPPFDTLSELPFPVTVLPEFADGQPAIRVRAMPDLDDCVVPIEVRVTLTNPEPGIQDLLERSANIASAAALCAEDKLVDDLVSYLSQEELNLLGLKLTFDFEVLKQGGGLPAGVTPLPARFVEGQFVGCDAPPQTLEIPNFRIDLDLDMSSFGIDLGALEEAERLAVGAAVRCRLLETLGDVAGHVAITNLEIGRNLLVADVALKHLPFLGEITLPRVDFADLDRAPSEKLREVLGGAAAAVLGNELLALLGDEVKVPGVGTFRPSQSGLTFDLFNAKAITMTGIMSFSDEYDLEVRMVLPLAGDGLSGFKIEPIGDPFSVLGNQLVSYLSELLPFPGNDVKLIAPRVAKLDDTGHQWGLVFGLTIDMTLYETGFRIAIQRIAISQAGVEMDQEIRMGLKVPVYMPPVALSQIIVIYNTGADGGSKGLSLGADLTAVEPELSKVLKIESILDLRDIDDLRFVIEGRLIAFDTVPLLEATGTLDLGNKYAEFEAATTGAIKDFINAAAEGRIDEPQGLIEAMSELALLGVEMQSSELRFCTRSCDPAFPDGGSAKLEVAHDFLFGTTSELAAQTDLEFRNPSLGAGVGLNLFGWKPGRARVDANLSRTRLELRFLGIRIGITVPTMELMTPGLIADVLKSLLDIRLEDLLQIPPDKIEITLMKGDGSMTQTSSSDSAESDGSESDDGEGRQGVPTGKAEAPRPAATTAVGDAEEAGEESATGPGQPFWGQRVTGIYCEEVASRNAGSSATEISVGDYYELWGETFENPADARSPLCCDHPHEIPTFHSPVFNAQTATEICAIGQGPTLQLGGTFANVGVARKWIGSARACEGHVPEFRYYRLALDNDEHKPNFSNAQRPVLCYEIDGMRYDIEARLLWRSSDQAYSAILYCPLVSDEVLSELETLPGWNRACGENQGSVDLGAFGDQTSMIDDSTELYLVEDRLRGWLLNGKPINQDTQKIDEGEFAHGDATVRFVQWPEHRDGGGIAAHRFELAIETDDPTITQIELLRISAPEDPSEGLWPWIQPDKKGMRAVILQRWLERGRQPEPVVSWLDQGWLVLEDRSDGRRDVLSWYRDRGNEPPERRVLDLPTRAPAGGGLLSGSRLNALHQGLLPLVSQLTPGSWYLQLGYAPESGLALYGFHSSDADDLMVHIHRFPPTDAADLIWIGAKAERSRTVCGKSADLKARLRETARADQRSRVSVDRAIADPDSLFREAGLRVHALGLITELGNCGG